MKTPKSPEKYLEDIGLKTNADFHLSDKTIPELMMEYAIYYHKKKTKNKNKH